MRKTWSARRLLARLTSRTWDHLLGRRGEPKSPPVPLSLCALEARVVPATLYWDGSSNNSWATVANWSTTPGGGSTPAAVPGIGDDVVFNATTVTTTIGTLGGNQSAKSITFSGNSTTAITLANNTLTIGSGGILVESGAAAVTIGSAIVLASAESWTNDSANLLTLSGSVSTAGYDLTVAGAGNTRLSGVVSGTGGLVKGGAGTLTMTAANTFTGNTAVSGGVLQVGSGGSTGSVASGSISVASGSSFVASRNNTTEVTLGAAFSGGGTVEVRGPGTSLAGQYLLGGNNSGFSGNWLVNSARARVTNATAFGSGSVTVTSGGGVYVTGGGTYTQPITLAGSGWVETVGTLGALRLQDGSTWSGAVTLAADAGIGTYSTTGTVSGPVDTGGYTLTVGGAGSTRFSGAINGSGGLVKAGTGTATLSAANTYGGATTVTSGTLQVGAGGSTGSLAGSSVSVAAGAKYLAYRNNTTEVNVATPFTGSGTVELRGTGASQAGQYLLGADNSSFSGTWLVTNARGRVTSPSGFGSGSVTVAGGGGVYVTGGGTYAQPISLAGNGWVESAGTLGALRLEDGSTWSGAITLASNARVGVNSTSGVLTGAIGGGYQLELWGRLAGAALTVTPSSANSYGSTRITGTVAVVTGSSGALSPNGLTMAGGTLSLNGIDATFASLDGTGGTVRNGSATTPATLTTSSGTFGGILADGAGKPFHLVKNGSGTLSLGGTNTFGGTASVTAGQLLITNGRALGGTSGGTTVSSGAQLSLSGDLTVNEPLTVSGSGSDGSGAIYGASGTSVVAGSVTVPAAATIGAASGAAVFATGSVGGPGSLAAAGGTPGQAAVHPALEYSISIGGMVVGETGGSSVGALSADPAWIPAASWQDAVQAAVSGYTGPTGGTSKYYFPGSRYVVGDAATLGATIANNVLATFVPGETKLIAYEDYTDNDYDDDYWVVTANVRAKTATTLAATPSPCVLGQSVALVAQVGLASPGSGPVKSGSVTFKEGSTVIGTGAVNSSGVAAISTSSLSVGTHAVTATYGGYGAFSASSSSTVVIVVTNTPPVAGSDSYGTVHNRVLTVSGNGVLANDGPTGAATSVSATPQVDAATAHGGKVTLQSDGSFTYTPPPDFVGTDSFGYQTVDNLGVGASGTATITVTNRPPTGQDFHLTTNRSLPVSVNLLLNAADPDLDPLFVDITVMGPFNGTYALTSGGSFTYTPGVDWLGTESIPFVIRDGFGGTVTKSVSIEVVSDSATVVTQVTLDSGVSNADRLTNDSSPAFSGLAEPGSTVTLSYRLAGTAEETVAGDGLADSTGAWEIGVPYLADGRYEVFAKARKSYPTENGSVEIPLAKSPPFAVVIDTVPPSDVFISVPERTTSRAPTITVTAADLNGFDPTATIEFDTDNDGVFEATEPHATAVDTGNGRYVFRAYGTLPTGPIGVRARVTDRAGNTTVSSTSHFTIDPEKSSLGGMVYRDANRDGDFDEGERGLGGVTVTLYGTVDGDSIEPRTAVTRADGTYSFTGLDAGTYRVDRGTAEGYDDGGATVGDHLGNVESPSRIAEITLSGGDNAEDYRFGLVPKTVLEMKVSNTVVTGTPFSAVVGSVPEGQVLLAEFTDADPERTEADYQASAVWGDPASPVVDAGTTELVLVREGDKFKVLGSPRFLQAGAFPIKVEVKAIYHDDVDESSQTGSGSGGGQNANGFTHSYFTTVTATVRPGGLTPVPADPFVTESGSVAGQDLWMLRFTGNVPSEDVPNYLAYVEWGDGSGEWREVKENEVAPGIQIDLRGAHAYSQPGEYTIRVTLSDAGFFVGNFDTPVRVTAVDPYSIQLTTSPFVFQEGDHTDGQILGVFAAPVDEWGDPVGTVALVEAFVDWGDGSPVEPAEIDDGVVAPNHTFVQVGTYAASVRVVFHIVDGSGQESTVSMSRSLTIIVEDDGIEPSQPGGGNVGLADNLVHIELADFTNDHQGENCGDYAATILWGDGQTGTGRVTGSAGTYRVDATHAFAEPGWYTVTVSIAEPRGFHPWTTQTTVHVVPPTEQEDSGGFTAGFVHVTKPADMDSGAFRSLLEGLTAEVKVTPERYNLGLGAGFFVPVTQGPPPDQLPIPLPDSSWREVRVGGAVFPQYGGYGVGIKVRLGGTKADLGAGVTVADAPLQPGAVTSVLAMALNPASEGTLATFTDPAALPTDGYTAIVDWGDGTSEGADVVPSVDASGRPTKTFIVRTEAGHVYEKVGTYQTTVIVHSGGGSSLVQTGVATVVPPTKIEVNAYQRRNERDNDSWHAAGSDGEVSTNTGAVRLYHELDFDLSPGTDVGLSPRLVYSSDTVKPRPFIESKFQLPPPARNAAYVVATLAWDGEEQLPKRFDPPATVGEPWLIAVRPDAPVSGTGLYDWSLKIRAYTAAGELVPLGVDPYGFDIEEMTDEGRTQVVDNTGSPFGSGWSLDTLWSVVPGVDDDGSAMVVYGTGESRLFENADGIYLSPREDTGRLAYADGKYTYTSAHGVVRRFDDAGRQIEIVDRHGLVTHFDYTGAGPAPSAVRTVDGNTVSIQSVSGGLAIHESGGREVFLEIDGGKLTGIANGGYRRSFGYDGGFLTEDARYSYGTILDQQTEYFYDPSERISTGYTLGATDSTFRLQSVAARALRGPDTYLTDPQWWPLTGRWIDPRGLESIAEFNANYKNSSTRIELDKLGRMKFVWNPDRTFESYGRDLAGRILRFQDIHQLGTKYSYVGDSVASTTFADGSSTSAGFDPVFNLPEWERSASGGETHYTLNEYGDVVQAVDALGNVTVYSYGTGVEIGLLESVTVGDTVTRFFYDDHRRLFMTIDPLLVVTEQQYDTAGNPTQTLVQGLQTRRTVYSETNHLVEAYDAYDVPTGKWSVNSLGRSAVATDARGMVTHFDYDDRGWLVRVTEGYGTPFAKTHESKYDIAGNLTDSIAPLVYDNLSGPAAPGGYSQATTHREFDIMNRLTRETEGFQTPFARSTDYAYDVAGISMTATFSQLYDAELEALGSDRNSKLIRNGTGYDGLGRIVRTATGFTFDTPGRTSVNRYDLGGRLVSVIDPLGIETEYGYDALDRVVAVTEAANTLLSRTTTTEYDRYGNVRSVQRPDGVTTSYEYTLRNQRSKLVEAEGTPLQRTTTYEYDDRGNLVEVHTPRAYDFEVSPSVRSVTTEYVYDLNNRLRVKTEGKGIAQSAWSPDPLNPQLLSHANPVTKYDYTPAGDLVTVTDPLNRVTKYSYDLFGRKAEELEQYEAGDFNNGTYFRGKLWTYDAADNVRAESTSGVSTDASARYRQVTNEYEYDLFGRRTKETRATAAFTYSNGESDPVEDPLGGYASPVGNLSYDAQDQVISATDPNGVVTKYTYTAHGDVQNVVEAFGTPVQRTTSYKYDADGRQINRFQTGLVDPELRARGYGSTSMNVASDYDVLGRVIATRESASLAKDKLTLFGYDLNDNKIAVVDAIGRRTEYAYDVFDRLVRTTEDAKAPAFVAVGNIEGGTGTGDFTRISTAGYDAADNLLWEARSRQYAYKTTGANPGSTPGQEAYVPAPGSPLDRALVTSYQYDALNRKVSTAVGSNASPEDVVALGHPIPVSYWQYDAGGRVLTELTPGRAENGSNANELHAVRYAYAADSGFESDSPVTATEGVFVTGSGGGFTGLRYSRMQYDGYGNLTLSTSGLVVPGQGGVVGTQSERSGTYDYDPLGHLMKSHTLVSLTNTSAVPVRPAVYLDTFYRYDANGNLKTQVQYGTDAAQPKDVRSVSFDYDELNRATTKYDAPAYQASDFAVGYQPVSSVTEAETTPLLGHALPITEYVYDAFGNLALTTAPDGETSVDLYDGFGQLVMQSRGWISTSFVYATDSTAIYPLITYLKYDQAGRLIETKQRGKRLSGDQYEFRTSTTEFDPLDRPIKSTDGVGTPLARSTVATYDTLDNPLTTTRGVSDTSTLAVAGYNYEYNSAVISVMTYDALGRKSTVAITEPSAGSTFGVGGQPQKQFFYDAAGRVVLVRQNTGTAYASRVSIDRIERDQLGRVTSTVSGLLAVATPNGGESLNGDNARVVTAAYDSSDHVRTSIDGNGVRTLLTYDNAGNAISQATGPDNDLLTTRMEYNAFGQPTRVFTPVNGDKPNTTEYDRMGRARELRPLGNDYTVTKNTYDVVGNLAKVEDITTPSWYDDNGSNPSTPNLSQQRHSITSKVYGTLGRIERENDPYGNAAYTSYNEYGQVAWIRNRNGDTTYFRYDSLGRKTDEVWVKAVGASGTVNRWLVFRYNANDQLVYTDEIDQPQTLLTMAMLRNGSALPNADAAMPVYLTQVKNTYDAAGRLAVTTNGFGISLSHFYSANGQVVRLVDSQNGETESTFDSAGRLTGRELLVNGAPVAKFSFAYKPNPTGTGRTDLLEQTDMGRTGVDPQDQKVSLAVVYDASGREVTRTWKRNDNTGFETLETSYWFATSVADGAVPGLVNSEKRTTTYFSTNSAYRSEYHYLYNSQGQIKQILQPNLPGIDFPFDEQGNIPLRNINEALWPTRPRVLSANPKIEVRGALTATGVGNATAYESGYDGEGNILELYDEKGRFANDPNKAWSYKYDNRNRLVTVDSGPTITSTNYVSQLTYDAMNRLVEWKAKNYGSGNYTIFERNVYDGNTLYARYTDGAISRMVYGPNGELLLRTDGQAIRYYITDRQNSVLLVVDQQGVPLKRLAYQNTNVVSRESYTGEPDYNPLENFELGGQPMYLADLYLQRYGDRWLMPKVGRFLTESGSTGLNPYVFADNSRPNAGSGLTGFWNRVDIAFDEGDNTFSSLAFSARAGMDSTRDGLKELQQVRYTRTSFLQRSILSGGPVGAFVGDLLWDTAFDLGIGAASATAISADAWGKRFEGRFAEAGRTELAGMAGVLRNSMVFQFGIRAGDPIGWAMGSVARTNKMLDRGEGLDKASFARGKDAAGLFDQVALLPLDLIGVGEIAQIGIAGIRAGAKTGARWLAKEGFRETAKSMVKATQVLTRVDRAVAFGVHQGIGTVAGKQSTLYHQVVNFAQRNGFSVCFAADTPMRTPTGHVMCQDVRENDFLLSRDEWNPNGMVVAQRVEEVFVRDGLVIELKVLGRTIRTTAEHPFHRYEDGWVACNQLKVGDRIALEEGWAEVEGVVDTGSWETVYNFRIAEFHTYFVGCAEWGFSIWAHNAYREFSNVLRKRGVDRETINAAFWSAREGEMMEARSILRNALDNGKRSSEAIERMTNRALSQVDSLSRPSQWRSGFVKKVEARMPKTPDGNPTIHDLVDGRVVLRERLPGEYGEIGHIPTMEHRKLVRENAGITQAEFNDLLHNNPDWFRIETRRLAASHMGEVQ